jgi:TRAP-type uncharacterized transport system substrate-binding protein
MGSSFFVRIAAAIICIIALVWLALWYFIPAPPSRIAIAAAPGFDHFAKRYQERLARHRVKATIRLTKGSVETAANLRDPKGGLDAGFMLGVTDSTELPDFVSLGRIAHSPIWFFYRGAETLDNLSQLKGKRVWLGPSSGRISTQILAEYGVNAGNTRFLSLALPRALQAFRAGEIDVMSTSQAISNPTIQSLLRDPTIRVMHIVQAEAVTKLFPSVDKVVLPQGVVDLERNVPPHNVNLVALTSVVLARANLHPELFYLLAQTMKEEHGRAGIFHRAGEFPTQTDPDFPVAEEALDYYRNGPSFLHRYLPFWMVNYAKRIAAIVVAAVAVVIPVFTYAPRLYGWLVNARLLRLYRRLRLVNAQLKRELTAEEMVALQNDIDHIDRAANILPMRHSDLFFSLFMHIDMTRTRLASRLRALRGLDTAA